MGVEEKQGTAFVNAEYLADDIYSYHLILLSDAEEMYNLWLPQTPEGFFRFSENREHRFLSISAKNGKWIASCKKPAFFQNVPLEQSCETVLEDGQLLKVDFDEISYSIYVEKISRKNKTFHNYFVPANLEVTIGSHPGCDIYYDNPLVSRNHAVLSHVRNSKLT